MNTLYYGDNLDILKRYVKDETVDLIYLDPPFNSNAAYNVLFAEHDGSRSHAQIQAFDDTWHWDMSAAEAYEEVVEGGGKVAQAMLAFRTLLGENDMMAYLAMMAPRLVELRRVLKPTGSLYLHCDPTASHYLKVLLDGVFGVSNLRNEIVWKRTSAHSSARRCGPIHDVILFYSRSDAYLWNHVYQQYDEEYLGVFFDQTDADGRRWKRTDLTGAGVRHGETGMPWRGIDITAKGRHWGNPPSVLDAYDAQGRIHWPAKADGMPRLKQYPEDLPGVPLQDVWSDIRPMHNMARERLGYPTQKPEALLERIVNASSNEGDLVLDPFCGCGTTVAVAERLNRRWIGIDITHLAITLMKQRLKDQSGGAAKFQVIGEPTSQPDAAALAASDPYQFQWWALGLVGARPAEGKKGADKGIDGRIYFHDGSSGGMAGGTPAPRGGTKQVILSVKAGHVTSSHIRDLGHVVQREGAEIGALITMQKPTAPMKTEAAAAGFYHNEVTGKKYPRLQILTVAELLEGRLLDRPYASSPTATFKKAPLAKKKGAKQLAMGDGGEGSPSHGDGAPSHAEDTPPEMPET